MRSSTFVPAGRNDSGVKNTLLSYLSVTDIDGTTRICCAAESEILHHTTRANAPEITRSTLKR